MRVSLLDRESQQQKRKVLLVGGRGGATSQNSLELCGGKTASLLAGSFHHFFNRFYNQFQIFKQKIENKRMSEAFSEWSPFLGVLD